jgi:NAD(P)-dependent dehydrogenase (short-subunit alcohol dehydrogenase family)
VRIDAHGIVRAVHCCPCRPKGQDVSFRTDGAEIGSLFRLDGRVAIVTGGTRGIGRAIAEGFGSSGARVVVASRKVDACREAEEALRSHGVDAIGVPCHMGSFDDIQALVETATDAFGGIDILVNNAANPLTEPLGQFTETGFAKSMDVNVKGPVFLIQQALPFLKSSPHASVINVASAAAWLFATHVALYASAKAAMVSYTKSMAAAFAADQIRVNALAPGTVDTDMVRNTGPEAAEFMAKASLMGRSASPFEMVGPAIFLASDASSFITGSVIHVDGGLVAR